MNGTPGPSQDMQSIQWLRGAAAMAVVNYHLIERLPSQGVIGGVSVGLPLAAGVDVFFCISGFIMYTIAGRRPVGPIAFLQSRAIRIIPLYWLITTVLVVGAALRPQWFGKLHLQFDHVLTSYLFIPMRSPIDGLIAPLLAPGWTLNFEMFFYLIFALCLLAPAARRLHLLTGILLGLFVTGLVLRPTSVIAQAYTSQLLLEFLAGAWIGALWQRGWLALSQRQALCVAASAIAALAATAPLGTATVDQYRALVWGVPALLLLATAVAREADIRIWPRLGARFGDVSYSLYLVHGLAIAVVAKALGFSASSGTGMQVVFVVTSLAVCAVAAWLCWRTIEVPLTHSLKSLVGAFTVTRGRHSIQTVR